MSTCEAVTGTKPELVGVDADVMVVDGVGVLVDIWDNGFAHSD